MNLKGKILIAAVALTGLTAGSIAIAQSTNTNTVESSSGNIDEKIIIEIINGKKKVTVTNTENGVQTIKIYEGEEAETFLAEHHSTIHGSHGDSLHSHFIMMDVMNELDMDFDGINEEVMEEIHKAMGKMEISINGENFDWNSHCIGDSSKKCEMKIMIDGEMEDLHSEMANLHEMINDMDIKIETEKDGDKTIKKIVIVTSEDNKISKSEITDADDEADLMKIYPNPSTGKFTIEIQGKEGTKTKLSIVDINGKSILSKEFKDSGKITENVNLKKHSAGNYIITVEQGGKILKEKVLVK